MAHQATVLCLVWFTVLNGYLDYGQWARCLSFVCLNSCLRSIACFVPLRVCLSRQGISIGYFHYLAHPRSSKARLLAQLLDMAISLASYLLWFGAWAHHCLGFTYCLILLIRAAWSLSCKCRLVWSSCQCPCETCLLWDRALLCFFSHLWSSGSPHCFCLICRWSSVVCTALPLSF